MLSLTAKLVLFHSVPVPIGIDSLQWTTKKKIIPISISNKMPTNQRDRFFINSIPKYKTSMLFEQSYDWFFDAEFAYWLHMTSVTLMLRLHHVVTFPAPLPIYWNVRYECSNHHFPCRKCVHHVWSARTLNHSMNFHSRKSSHLQRFGQQATKKMFERKCIGYHFRHCVIAIINKFNIPYNCCDLDHMSFSMVQSIRAPKGTT